MINSHLRYIQQASFARKLGVSSTNLATISKRTLIPILSRHHICTQAKAQKLILLLQVLLIVADHLRGKQSRFWRFGSTNIERRIHNRRHYKLLWSRRLWPKLSDFLVLQRVKMRSTCNSKMPGIWGWNPQRIRLPRRFAPQKTSCL